MLLIIFKSKILDLAFETVPQKQIAKFSGPEYETDFKMLQKFMVSVIPPKDAQTMPSLIVQDK